MLAVRDFGIGTPSSGAHTTEIPQEVTSVDKCTVTCSCSGCRARSHVTTHFWLRRNIFESKKYVEEYRASDITSELGLDRMKLVRMAQLLGSDYSPGVGGIGAFHHPIQTRNKFLCDLSSMA